jgi:hypothetical protein
MNGRPLCLVQTPALSVSASPIVKLDDVLVPEIHTSVLANYVPNDLVGLCDDVIDINAQRRLKSAIRRGSGDSPTRVILYSLNGVGKSSFR